MVLVDSGQRALDVPQCRGEYEPYNAPLFIAEERGERVVHVAVVAVEQANHLRKISALNLFGGLFGKLVELRRIALAVGFYGRGNVLVAEVQNRKGEALPMSGDGAGNLRASQLQASAAGGADLVGDAADVVAEEIGLLGKRGKDAADGIMGRHLLQAQLHGGHARLVDLRPIAGAGYI